MRLIHRTALRATVALLSTSAALVAASSVTPAHAATATVDIFYIEKQVSNGNWTGDKVYLTWTTTMQNPGYPPPTSHHLVLGQNPRNPNYMEVISDASLTGTHTLRSFEFLTGVHTVYDVTVNIYSGTTIHASDTETRYPETP